MDGRRAPFLLAALLIAFVGCGRLGFDETTRDADADAIAPDGPLAPFLLETNAVITGFAPASDGGVVIVAVASIANIVVGDLDAIGGFGGQDVVVARVQPDGKGAWIDVYGGGGYDVVTDVAVGADDVIGTFEGTASFGGHANSRLDGFVARYRGDGTHLWSRSFGGSTVEGTFASDDGAAIAVIENDIVIGGSLRGPTDFGNGVMPPVAGGEDEGFVARLAGDDGRAIWAHRYGAVRLNRVFDLAVDDAANVYLSGYYEGSEDFGDGPEPYRGVQDAVVASYDRAGVFRWSTTFGGPNFDYMYGLAVARGLVVVGGLFEASSDLPGVGDVAGGRDALLAAFSSADGEFAWARDFGAPSCDQFTSVVVESDGFLVSGNVDGMIDIGGVIVDTEGVDRAFFAAYDDAGIATWRALGDDASHSSARVSGTRDVQHGLDWR